MTDPQVVARREARYRGASILLGLGYLLLLALHQFVAALAAGVLFLAAYGRQCTLGGWLDGYTQRGR